MGYVKVLYVGNYRHPWCTETHLARELEGLGHDVVRMQEPPGGGNLGTVDAIEHAVEAHRPDLVMWTRTWSLPRAATDLWRRLERRGIVTASYHLDLYLGLQRESKMVDDPFWTTQYVFTPDGDPGSARTFAAMGINHHWSPPAVVSDECVPGVFRQELAYQFVFVGSYDYHPEWPWRRELIDWLQASLQPRFKRFGGDMPNGPTRGQDLNDLYASCAIVIGDSLCLPGHVNYWSDRPYETVGRGGFLFMPRVPGLEQHFTDREHLWFYDYGDLEGLNDLLDAAMRLGHEGRRAVAKAGQEHVAAHHTYRHRLAAALQTMGFE